MLIGSLFYKKSQVETLMQMAFTLFFSLLVGFVWTRLEKKHAGKFAPRVVSQPLQRKGQAAILAGCAVAAVWLFQSTLELWQTTDDFFISCVTGSVYAKENYCIFVNPIVTKLVGWIHAVLPKADGWTLLGELLVLAGMWCLFYVSFLSFSPGSTATMILFIIAANNKLNLLHQPFAAMTGEFFCFGIFVLYAVYSGKVGKGMIVPGTLLLVFASLWRWEAFLLGLPYLAMILLAEFMVSEKDRKETLSSMMKAFLPALILCTVCMGVKILTDVGEKYGPGIEYHNLRSNIVDFPMKDYEDGRDAYEKAGISENDLHAAEKMILADTETVTTDYLRNIAETGYMSYPNRIPLLKNLEAKEIQHYFNSSRVLQILIIAAAVLVLLLSDASPFHKWELILACAGDMVICLYFLSKGHMVNYVFQTCLIYTFMVLLTILLRGKFSSRHESITKKIALLAAVLLAVFWYSGIDLSPEASSLTAHDTTITRFDDPNIEEDAVYVWGVYDYIDVLEDSDFMTKGQLLSEEFVEHNLVDGEWMYNQPYYLDYLHRLGIENPMKALTDREQTYYVGNEERCKMILKFLHEHDDENVTVENVGEICGVPMWRFLK